MRTRGLCIVMLLAGGCFGAVGEAMDEGPPSSTTGGGTSSAGSTAGILGGGSGTSAGGGGGRGGASSTGGAAGGGEVSAGSSSSGGGSDPGGSSGGGPGGAAGGVCGSGDCPGAACCAGACSDLASDPQNCGACGLACPLFSICVGAACEQIDGGTSHCPDLCSAGATCVDADGGALCVPAACAEGGCRTITTLATGTAAPGAIAVDDTNVYFTEPELGTVSSISLTGSVPVTVGPTAQSPPQGPFGLTLSVVGVFWSAPTNPDGAVWEASFPSLSAEPLGSAGSPTGVAASATHVYWADQASLAIRAAPLDGGMPVQLAPAHEPLAVAIDGQNLYWTDQGYGVLAVSLDGGVPWLLAGGVGGTAIAASVGSVYWVDGQDNGSVYAFPAGGSPTIIAVGQQKPMGIAVDRESVYWTDMGAGTVQKAPLAGGALTMVATGQDNPFGIAVDGTSVYWTAGSAIMKATPK